MPPSHGLTDSTQPPHQMIGRGLGVTGSQAVSRTLNAWGRVSLALPHPVWVLVAELGGRERGQVSVALRGGGRPGLPTPSSWLHDPGQGTGGEPQSPGKESPLLHRATLSRVWYVRPVPGAG